jgi:hypothetical protein
VFTFVLWLGATSAFAQSAPTLEIEGQLATLALSEFDVTSVGVAVQAGWHVGPVLAIDGALAYFPGDGAGSQFLEIDHQRKVLGLVGVRARAERGRVSAFVRARPGFLRFVSEDRVACIAIAVFPLPLACQVLAGTAVFAAELGGGAHVSLPGERAFVSVELADVLLRYPGDAFRPGGEVAREPFISHNPRVSVGLGWRF